MGEIWQHSPKTQCRPSPPSQTRAGSAPQPRVALWTLPSDSQQMGHHVSKPGSWGDWDPRKQADGKWGAGQSWHKAVSQTGWNRALAGLSLPRLTLCLSGPGTPSGVPETLWEPCRLWGQAWAAGERGHGCGEELGTHFLTPLSTSPPWHRWAEAPPRLL